MLVAMGSPMNRSTVARRLSSDWSSAAGLAAACGFGLHVAAVAAIRTHATGITALANESKPLMLNPFPTGDDVPSAIITLDPSKVRPGRQYHRNPRAEISTREANVVVGRYLRLP